MRLLLGFLAFSFFSHYSYSHDYYFAFAEMEYNSVNKKFELSLVVSTHDIEHWLKDKGVPIKELEDHLKDSTLQSQIGSTLLDGYSVKMNNSIISFKIVGFEVKNDGLTEFYFSSSTVDIQSPILVSFDLLMDIYEQQQNKLTFIYKATKHTYPFLYTNREQTIEF